MPTSPYRHDAAGVSVIELEGGATAVWDCNYATPGPETGWNGEWELVGERGRLSWRGGNPDANTGELTLAEWRRPARPVDLPELPHADSAAALQAFISAVETGAQPEASVADNLRTLAILFGSIESVETGGVVRLADLVGKVGDAGGSPGDAGGSAGRPGPVILSLRRIFALWTAKPEILRSRSE